MSDPNENRTGYKETKEGWIPVDWGNLNVGECASVTTGPFGTTLKASEYSNDGGVPVVSVGEIRDGFLEVKPHTPRVTEVVTNRLPKFLLEIGDIILARKGAVDRCAVVSSGEVGWFLGSDGIRLRFSDELCKKFLAYSFQSHRVRKQLIRNALGTTMLSMNQEILGKIHLVIPPSPEQEQIAEILSTCDEAIEKTGDLIDAKKRQKKALMQQLLTGKKRLRGFGGDKKTTLTRTGEIPSDWKWTHLGEAFKKRVQRSGDALPLMAITIDSGMVRRDSIERKVESELTESDNLFARKGDIAYNTMRMWQGAVGVAAEDCHVSPAYVVCSPKAGVADSEFYYHWFKSAEGLHLLWSYSYGITGDRLRLYAADFSLVPAPLPSIEEQRAIVAVLKSAEEEIEHLMEKQAVLKTQKKSLMQKLLTGQVRVKV